MHACTYVCAQSLSHVQLFVTPWTVAHQASLSMGFSRQEDWSGLPCPPPGDLPNPGIKLRSPALQVDSLPSEPPGMPINNVRLKENSKALFDRLCLVCPTEQNDSETAWSITQYFLIKYWSGLFHHVSCFWTCTCPTFKAKGYSPLSPFCFIYHNKTPKTSIPKFFIISRPSLPI